MRRNVLLTLLVKAIDFNRRSSLFEADGGIKSRSAQTVSPARKIFSNGTRERNFLTGFTLTELMIVVILAGVLASIALPSYTETRERTLDKEAVSSLRAIRTANMKYYTKREVFWPPQGAGWISNITFINGNLSVGLSNASWAFQIQSIAAGQSFRAWAQRAGRTWRIDETFGDPTCVGSCL